MTKCKICGQDFSDNHLAYHLKKTHGISPKEYYDEYVGKTTCTICGGDTKFLNVIKGYAETCAKCNKDIGVQKVKKAKSLFTEERKEEINNKRKKTNIDRFGVDCLFNRKDVREKNCSKEVRNKAQKTYKKTCLDKYGVDNYLKTDDGKNSSQTAEAKKKRKETFFNTTGVNSPMKIPGVKEKISETVKNKYGVDSYIEYLNLNNVSQNIKDKNIEKFEKENDCTLLYKLVREYGQGWYKAKIITDLIILSNQRVFVKNKDIEKIKQYSKESLAQSSVFEKEIAAYIEKELKQTVLLNNRKIIAPYEIDIYSEKNKLGIECDGSYWHSVNSGTDKNAQLRKTEQCDNKNIKLIHIFEYEWANKRDICKSLIASAFGVYSKKIYARNCELKEVDNSVARKFLDDNHIQGAVNSSYRLGLFYNDELVQLICIGKSRFKEDEYELLRMCTKLNTQVVGGFSKLMKHQPYNTLVSFVDRSKFDGKAYFSTNWKLVDISKPNYVYVKGNTVLNRMSAQKHKLHKLLGNNFNPNLTETENMVENNWLKIYDCGNIKLEFNKTIIDE